MPLLLAANKKFREKAIFTDLYIIDDPNSIHTELIAWSVFGVFACMRDIIEDNIKNPLPPLHGAMLSFQSEILNFRCENQPTLRVEI